MTHRLPKSSMLHGAACALLFACVFAVFSPSIRYSLVDFDDPAYITGNAIVLHGVSPSALRAAFVSRPADVGMYMPLLWISYMADVSFFGASPSNPAPFHAVNATLHAANAVLFFLLLLRLPRLLSSASFPLSPNVWRLSSLSFLFSLLWALHPLRVESVAWVTERKDTLSLFFALLSLLFYLHGRQRGHPARDGARPPSAFGFSLFTFPRDAMRQGLSFLFFAAALLVKPTLVPFPVLLVLLDLFVLRRPLSLRLVLSKIPYFLFAAAAAIATLAGHSQPGLSLPLAARILHLPQTCAHYLHLTFFPLHLTPLDPRPHFATIPSILDAILLAALFLLAVRVRRSRPLATLGILWFFLFLLPVSGLVTIPNNTVADRFSYVPALGFSIALLGFLPLPGRVSPGCAGKSGAASPRFLPPPRILHSAFCILLGVILVAEVVLSLRQLPHWRSSSTFYGRIRRFKPHNPFVALHDAQTAIVSAGDFSSALRILRDALPFAPDSHQLLLQTAEAIANVEGPQPALDFLAAHRPPAGSLFATWAWHMAHLSLRAGRPGDALSFASLAENGIPSFDTLHENIRRLRIAATSPDPADALPHAISQWMTYHRADALEGFRRLLAAYPDRPDFLCNVAWILSTADWSPAPPSEALSYASRALDLAQPVPPHEILDTYAASLANASEFSAAATAQQRALDLLSPDSTARPDYLSRLSLYLQNQPFRHDIGIESAPARP